MQHTATRCNMTQHTATRCHKYIQNPVLCMYALPLSQNHTANKKKPRIYYTFFFFLSLNASNSICEYVWRDLFICVTWLIHMRAMTQSHVWYDSFTCVTWLIHVCDTMHESCHTFECVMSHIWMRHVTHMKESCHTYAWVMSHIRTSRVTHMHE